MSACRAGWRRLSPTSWKWGKYSIRRRIAEHAYYLLHVAIKGGKEIGKRQALEEAQQLCEQHAAYSSAKVSA